MRVGLAAGYNKDGVNLPIGYDYVVVGTVTRRPRLGNPEPNIQRVEGGLLNWVGMANPGVDAVAENLSSLRHDQEVWVSIAGESIDDVVYCYDHIVDHAAKVELNISSPNVEGLQRDPVLLEELLSELGDVVVKLPLADDAYALADASARAGVTELTVANSLATPHGGLSGLVIRGKAQRMLERMRVRHPDMVIHACGGIASMEDLVDVKVAGAASAQVHTAVRLEHWRGEL